MGKKTGEQRKACSSDLHCHLGHLSAATVMVVWLYSLISTGIEFGFVGFRGTNSCLFVALPP